jgi:hypothetical protein
MRRGPSRRLICTSSSMSISMACAYCGKTYQQISALLAHRNREHPTKRAVLLAYAQHQRNTFLTPRGAAYVNRTGNRKAALGGVL